MSHYINASQSVGGFRQTVKVRRNGKDTDLHTVRVQGANACDYTQLACNRAGLEVLRAAIDEYLAGLDAETTPHEVATAGHRERAADAARLAEALS